jgi:hypothetical protein
MSDDMMVSIAKGDLDLSVLTAEEALGDPGLVAAWRARLGDVHRANRLLASPEWFESRRLASPGPAIRVAVLRDRGGEPLGMSPMILRPVPLQYYIARRVFGATRPNAAVILGSEPLLPRSPAIYRRFFDEIFEALPGCLAVYFDAMPAESFAWSCLRGDGRRSGRYFSYLSRGEIRDWWLVDLEGTFDSYLGRMKGESRYKLRRSVRELRKHCGGRLDIRRFDSVDDVGVFVESARRVWDRTWQHRIPEIETALIGPSLSELARSGMLRSYLLESGGVPLAYVVGYQYEGTFIYAECGYDEDHARYSPGTVLLYLLLEDLYAHDRPDLLNFGVGYAPYKQRFSNHTTHDGSLYLFRKTPANRMRHASHWAFHSGVRLAKRLLKVRRLEGPLRG